MALCSVDSSFSIGTVYEVALSEWGLAPDDVNEKFTEELLLLMWRKRAERLEAEERRRNPNAAPKRTSDMAFLAAHSGVIKVVKVGGK